MTTKRTRVRLAQKLRALADRVHVPVPRSFIRPPYPPDKSGHLLDGRRALIIGTGANIGHSITLEMARYGASVLFTDMDAGRCERLKAELAIDLAPYGLRVNGIATGFVKEDEHGCKMCASDAPLFQRLITPKCIGRTSVYLAADYVSLHTTGTVLKIDARTTANNHFARMFPLGPAQP